MELSIFNRQLLEKYLEQALDFTVAFAPKMFLAILSLYAGFFITEKLLRVFSLTLEKTGLTIDIRNFVLSFVSIAMKFAVMLFAASFLGFELASLLGIMAAASFAVAFALQGSLSNLVSGLLIMVLKPFKIGDIVRANDTFGKVEDIRIFNTVFSNPSLETLVIPNRKLMEDTIINYSMNSHVRLDIKITIPYSQNFSEISQVCIQNLKSLPMILENPKPEVAIDEFDSHNIVLSIRPYVKPEDYWKGTLESRRLLKSTFSQKNVQMAYERGFEMGAIAE